MFIFVYLLKSGINNLLCLRWYRLYLFYFDIVCLCTPLHCRLLMHPMQSYLEFIFPDVQRNANLNYRCLVYFFLPCCVQGCCRRCCRCQWWGRGGQEGRELRGGGAGWGAVICIVILAHVQLNNSQRFMHLRVCQLMNAECFFPFHKISVPVTFVGN